LALGNIWAEKRYAIQQAADDEALGRNTMQVRAADGRSVVYVDKATGAAIPATPSRRIGGLV